MLSPLYAEASRIEVSQYPVWAHHEYRRGYRWFTILGHEVFLINQDQEGDDIILWQSPYPPARIEMVPWAALTDIMIEQLDTWLMRFEESLVLEVL